MRGNKQNLIDISKRPDFKELVAKGGIGNADTNMKKSLSAKKRWMKINNPDLFMSMEMFKSNNPNDSFDMLVDLINQQHQDISRIDNPLEKIKMTDNNLKRLYEYLKIRFGTKSQSINANLNANMSTANIVLNRLQEMQNLKAEHGEEKAHEILLERAVKEAHGE